MHLIRSLSCNHFSVLPKYTSAGVSCQLTHGTDGDCNTQQILQVCNIFLQELLKVYRSGEKIQRRSRELDINDLSKELKDSDVTSKTAYGIQLAEKLKIWLAD